MIGQNCDAWGLGYRHRPLHGFFLSPVDNTPVDNFKVQILMCSNFHYSQHKLHNTVKYYASPTLFFTLRKADKLSSSWVTLKKTTTDEVSSEMWPYYAHHLARLSKSSVILKRCLSFNHVLTHLWDFSHIYTYQVKKNVKPCTHKTYHGQQNSNKLEVWFKYHILCRL